MSELPEGWVRCVISDVAKIVAGGTPASTDKTNFAEPPIGIPWITPADLTGFKHQYIANGARNISDKGFEASSAKKMPAGTVLFSSRAPVGYVAIAMNQITTSQGFKSFVLPKEVCSKYVYQYLRHIKPLANQMATGTTFKELSGSVAALLPFLLPPLPEQTRIANKLDTLLARVDSARDRLDLVPEMLKRFRQAVLTVATSGVLTEGWRSSKNLPQWQKVTLGDIADIQGGVTVDAKRQSLDDVEVPYLRVANVQRGYIDLTEVKSIRVPAGRMESLLLETGDILFNEGGDLDKLGRGWIWESQVNPCSFQNHVFRARLRDKNIQPKFISWWGNHCGLDYFVRSGKQTTNLASINKRILCNLPINLPTTTEQTEIVRQVEILFAYADRLEARLKTARKLSESLSPAILAKAFQGELVAQDPNDEPAVELLKRIRAGRK